MAKKCNFRKKDGQRCGADAQPGKTLCIFHDPAKAEDGRRARREGGINRTRAAMVLPPETLDNPLRNSQDASTLLAESINQVLRGQLDLRVAKTITYMTSVLLTALDQGVEARLAKLEAALGIGPRQSTNNSQEEATNATPITASAN